MTLRTRTAEMLADNGYENVRQLPDGRWIATLQQMFTTGLFVGLDDTGYRMRFCYEYESEAKAACEQWDGTDDPPGAWIVRKGSGEDRLGPGATHE